MQKKRKILVICGPTATGKTALGIHLAKKFSAKGGSASGWNGEIVSADSRQVYQGMDIGTGKDLPVNSKSEIRNPKQIPNSKFQIPNHEIKFYEINGVKVWLYDIVKPDYRFSVADYVKCANLVIEDIYKRGKLPIIVGGTGLYIKALIDGIVTIGVPPDWKLRKRLANCSIAQLSNKLKKLNPQKWQSMNNSDRNNSRRLIRAIELARSNSLLQHINVLKQKTETLWLGLTASFDELYKRIDQRVEKRIKMGMEDEIKSLQALGYNFENSAMGTTIGYKEFRDADIQKWKFAEHAYARRQMTWFKKDKRINWFDVEKRDWRQAVEEEVGKWYNNNYSSSKARSPKR